MQIIAADLGVRNRPETKLLIHPTGADQSQAITDASFGGPKTITVAGDTKIVAQDMWHPFPSGTSAVSFGGAGSYLAIPASDDFNFGTGDFTLHGWFNMSTYKAYQVVLGNHADGNFTGGYAIEVSSARGGISLLYLGTILISAVMTFTAGLWYHFAAARKDGVLYIFVNGILKGSTPYANSMTSSSPMWVGRYTASSTTYDFLGYMQEVTIVKGRALWTRSFTPPNRPA